MKGAKIVLTDDLVKQAIVSLVAGRFTGSVKIENVELNAGGWGRNYSAVVTLK